jgi:protein disulfide-isomerase
LKKLFIPFIIILALIAGCGNKSSDNLKWETNLETALKLAKQENKAVLINFTGSDWCVWCKRLSEEVFSKEAFEDYAEGNLILVKVDFPRNIEQTAETKMYNNRLAEKYQIQGFPTIILLNSRGNVIGVTGYQPGGPEAYIAHLKSFI